MIASTKSNFDSKCSLKPLLHTFACLMPSFLNSSNVLAVWHPLWDVQHLVGFFPSLVIVLVHVFLDWMIFKNNINSILTSPFLALSTGVGKTYTQLNSWNSHKLWICFIPSKRFREGRQWAHAPFFQNDLFFFSVCWYFFFLIFEVPTPLHLLNQLYFHLSILL